VVVANIGVWYNNETLYTTEVKDFLQWMHEDIGLSGDRGRGGSGGGGGDEDVMKEPRNNISYSTINERGIISSSSSNDRYSGGGGGRSLAVFLESFPQHVPTPRTGAGAGGRPPLPARQRISYSVPAAQHSITLAVNKSHCCVPITNHSHRADWRNRILRDVTARHHYHSVSILPVAEAFMPAHNMHTCGGGRVDCTHYCFWPMQLQFEWHALAKIVEQQCIGSKCV
jgi:hypothetical protein